MNIKELIESLFGKTSLATTIVDRWKTYTVNPGYITTQKIQSLTKKFNVFGRDNKGNQLIITGDSYVLITYPPYEKRRDPIQISIREDNLRPVFINDMTEEADFEGNRQAPKLRYGFIWRSQLGTDKSLLLQQMRKEAETDFHEYEADNKSWVLIETTMLNKTDTVPQLRVSFKPGEMANTEEGVFMMFSGGFIAIDKNRFVTLALDYEVSKGLVNYMEKAVAEDEAAVMEIFKRLKTPLTPLEGTYMAFPESNFETSLLSAIANNV